MHSTTLHVGGIMSKRICIFGGSGFVGHAIVHAARNQGYAVTVACRHPQRARHLSVEHVRLAKADVTDGHGIDEAVSDADVVINLVGLLFEKGRQTFAAAHVEGTERVLAACEKTGIRHYLHMSALGADIHSTSAYARTKAEAEARVRQSDLNWTIFRPSIIFGEHDSFFNKFKQMSKWAPALPVIEGNTRFQPIWVEDVAQAFVKSICNRHAYGQTFELGGPKIYSFRELLELLLKALGRKRLLLPVPRPAARIMAAVMQMLPTPPLTPDQLILLARDNVVQGDAYPPMFGKPASVEDILPTYIDGGQVNRLQHNFDRYRKDYWNAR